jgi:hypothetical protein
MAKEISLEETWELCLEMWKWISDEATLFEEITIEYDVHHLKRAWLKSHGFKGVVYKGCFFCHFGKQRDRFPCRKCPGRLVDGAFTCMHDEYHYEDKPKEFYNKLLKLNKIRKGNTMKEMTVAEISRALGEEIKIVKEKPKVKTLRHGDYGLYKGLVGDPCVVCSVGDGKFRVVNNNKFCTLELTQDCIDRFEVKGNFIDDLKEN